MDAVLERSKMTTKYDIGDLVKLNVIGKIIGYSIDASLCDGYSIILALENGDEFATVSLSTKDLEYMEAKKIVAIPDPTGISSRPILKEA